MHPAIARTAKQIEETSARLYRIDALIKLIDFHLNDLQPPATGKIRIHFYKNRLSNRNPKPFVWRRVRGCGDIRWAARPVRVAHLVQRARKSRDVHENYRIVKTLLAFVALLIAHRRSLIEAIQSFTMSIENRGPSLNSVISDGRSLTTKLNKNELTARHFGRQTMEDVIQVENSEEPA